VNLDGEPERDDSGLPPVDIEIPDDARELDRDVQAYRREQRALRRQLRRRRLRGPLTGDGMVMPLLAGCLVFALIAAVLLTVFAATGDIATKGPTPPGALPRNTPGTLVPARTTSPSLAITPVGGTLPDKSIVVRGRSVPLRNLTASALALVPAGCACTKALQQLISQAARTRVILYLVGTSSGGAGLQAIAARNSGVRVADDRQNVLAHYRAPDLTLLLVSADGSLSLAHGVQPGQQLQSEFAGLRQPVVPATSPSTWPGPSPGA
jgi:hypothetical protein